MEELINKLKNSDLKLLEKLLGIPYDRMYKWVKGKSQPKLKDYNTLVDYFENGKTSMAEKRANSLHSPPQPDFYQALPPKEIKKHNSVVEVLMNNTYEKLLNEYNNIVNKPGQNWKDVIENNNNTLDLIIDQTKFETTEDRMKWVNLAYMYSRLNKT